MALIPGEKSKATNCLPVECRHTESIRHAGQKVGIVSGVGWLKFDINVKKFVCFFL